MDLDSTVLSSILCVQKPVTGSSDHLCFNGLYDGGWQFERILFAWDYRAVLFGIDFVDG